MTVTAQDFEIYAGDNAQPLFTTVDANSNPIPLSGVQDIVWTARRTPLDTIVITKKKSTAGILFVTDGNDGKFTVQLVPADTSALSGYYIHQVVITDSKGSVSTDATGRMQIGILPIWTYSGDPASSSKDGVRYLIGDIDNRDKQVQDSEILFALTQRSSLYGAAGIVCRALSARYSREADSVQAELRTLYSSRARAYATRAIEYDRLAMARGGVAPYAGGISIADKQRQEQNTDRVQPQFTLGEDVNYLPLGPAQNETEETEIQR